MKHYRSYMDRITAPAGLRQRVLEAAGAVIRSI